MKKFLLFVCIYFLSLSGFSQSTFRLSYDVASFDLAGGMVMTPAGEYVFAGTNSTFIPFFGNIVKLDNTGTVLWAKSYTGGIATALNDLKNVSTGGFVTCGQSSSGGAVIMRVDNSGNLIWAKRYQLPNISGSKTSNEFFNSVIETADGGFLAVGGVDYFWDGVSASTVDTTSLFVVKTNSLGVMQWNKVWTINVANPDEHYLNDCAEVSDGYILVGESSEGAGAASNGDYPRNAIIIKVDKTTGATTYINRFGAGNTTSQGINGITTLASGNVLLGGYDDLHAFVARLQGPGAAPTLQFGRRINGAAFPLSSYLIRNLMENSDGNYSFIGWRIAGLFPTLNSAIIKMNSGTGAIMLGKTYAPIGLSSILPEGGLSPTDQGYFFVNTDQQATGFNYNVVRTNSLGDIGIAAAGCTNTTVNPSTQAYGITFQAVPNSEFSPATEASFVPLVNNIVPTQVTHCLNCNLNVVPIPTITPNPICAGQSATVAITNTVAGYNYNVFTTSTGGASIGSAPLIVSPVTTTTYYIEVQSQSLGTCLSGTRTPVTLTVNPTPTITVGATPNPICVGNNLALSASGAGTYTWSGPNSFTSSASNPTITNIGTINAGTYTVSGTLGGCSSNTVVSVTVNNNPTASASSVSSTLCANSTISLTGSPNGMTTYSWSGPSGFTSSSQNPTIPGATTAQSGTYTLTVTNGSGCTGTAVTSVTVSNSPGVTTSSGGTLTCSSTTAQAISSTTTSPATYTWSGPGVVSGVNSGTATVNQPGTYTVTVMNSSGCTTASTLTIASNTIAPSVTASSSNTITCTTQTSQVIASTTVSPVTYTWTGTGITAGVNTATATVNASGVFTVNITNTANGCTSSATTAVSINTTAPSGISVSPSAFTISCATPTTQLSVSSTGGNTYTWTPPVTGSILSGANSATANISGPGVYSVVVTGTNGCSAAAATATVTAAGSPVAVAGAGSSTLCANSTISLTGMPNGMTTYSWTGPSSYTSNVQNPTIPGATPLQSGTYTLIVIDNNGCIGSASVTVTVNTGANVSTSSGGTITCSATTVQAISTTTSSPVTYTWSGPGIVSGVNSATAIVNQSGNYTVTVMNAAGCPATSTLAITSDTTAPSASASNSSTITCTNPNIQVTASSTTSPVSYTWTGPGVVSGANTATATVNAGGIYSVTITNTLNGCSNTATTAVSINTTVPSGISVSPSAFTISCLTPTAQLAVSSTGGNTFTWTPPATGAILSGVNSATANVSGPGVYSVVVTGTNGCSAPAGTATVVADANSPAVTLSSNSVSITCVTSAPSVTATPSGTVPITSYSWSPASGISSGANSATPVFTASGTYSCLLTAANGCTASAFVTVSDNTVVPSASTPTVNSISCANPNVIINPSYTPSTGLTYTWTGTGIVGSSSNGSVTVNQNGTYTVSFADAGNGCNNTMTISITGNTIAPTATISSSTSTLGIGCAPGTDTAVLSGSSTPSTGITYSWSTGATTSSISTSTPGTYTLVVTDPSNGCSVSTLYTVNNNTTAPSSDAGISNSLPCGGTLTLNGSSTTSGVTYSWSGAGIISGSNTPNPVVDQPGIYTLTVTNPVTGCTSTSTVAIVNTTVVAGFTSDVTTGVAPLTVNLTNTSTGAINYSWNFGNGSTSIQTNTAAIYNSSGTFTIILIASSGTCSDSASLVIVVNDDLNIEIPNVFTPNGDGTNDLFTINTTGVKEITLEIYNRWGQKMYEFTGPKAAWDGICNNGNKATDGTYFYFVKAIGYSDKEITKNGTIGLYR